MRWIYVYMCWHVVCATAIFSCSCLQRTFTHNVYVFFIPFKFTFGYKDNWSGRTTANVDEMAILIPIYMEHSYTYYYYSFSIAFTIVAQHRFTISIYMYWVYENVWCRRRCDIEIAEHMPYLYICESVGGAALFIESFCAT